MKLQEIFDQLRYGEFSQLCIGEQPPGVINEDNYPNVLSHVNLGLTTLFTRFLIKEDRVVLKLQAGQEVYQINSQFAVNNRRSREPVRYLLDTEYLPFGDNVMKIEGVLTDTGYELHINDRGDPLSVHTPSALVLRVPEMMLPGARGQAQLPEDLRTEKLELVYRANHPRIVQSIGFWDPARIDVELPASHLQALLYFVASRVHNPIGMVNEFNAGNNYAAKYEQACQQLEIANVLVDQGAQYDRLHAKGFV